jgi:hypothetical protein
MAISFFIFLKLKRKGYIAKWPDTVQSRGHKWRRFYCRLLSPFDSPADTCTCFFNNHFKTGWKGVKKQVWTDKKAWFSSFCNGYSKNLDSGQWTVDSERLHHCPPTARVMHRHHLFPTSHTVLSYEVNLVYLAPSRQLNWRLTDYSAYQAVCCILITAKWPVETGEIPLPL